MDAESDRVKPHGDASPGTPEWWEALAVRGRESLEAADGGVADGESASEPAAAPEQIEGGCLSNTHPLSSQVVIEGYSDLLAVGAVDWFEWSASVRWPDSSFRAIMDALAAAKEECQVVGGPDRMVKLLNGLVLRVGRSGFNRGGDRGQHFKYKVWFHGICIGLADRQGGLKGKPNLCVCLTGRDCLLVGALPAKQHIQSFLDACGARSFEEKLTRVDLCLDIAGLDVRQLVELVLRKQFVTQARGGKSHDNFVTDDLSGFDVGTSPLRLICYDKLLELRNKADALYLQAMIDRRWGGTLPAHATRIEFQVRRSKLLTLGVSSPTDLFTFCGAVLDKLLTEWFRLTAETVDRKNHHQGRVAVHPLWQGIHKAFLDAFGRCDAPLVPIKREAISPARLVWQAMGCLRNALLQMGVECPDFPAFLRKAFWLVCRIFGRSEERKRFMRDFFHRRSEYGYEQRQGGRGPSANAA